MSFNNKGPHSVGACKIDYEAQAKNLKEHIELSEDLKVILIKFIEKGNTYRFDNISSLAELLGGLTIAIRQNNHEYNRILSMIEKSK